MLIAIHQEAAWLVDTCWIFTGERWVDFLIVCLL